MSLGSGGKGWWKHGQVEARWIRKRHSPIWQNCSKTSPTTTTTWVDTLPIPIMVRDLCGCESSRRTSQTTKRWLWENVQLSKSTTLLNRSVGRPREESRNHGCHKFGRIFLPDLHGKTKRSSRRVCDRILSSIDRLRLVIATLKCDQEPSTLELTRVLASRCKTTVLTEGVSPRGSKGRLDRHERANLAIQRQLWALRARVMNSYNLFVLEQTNGTRKACQQRQDSQQEKMREMDFDRSELNPCVNRNLTGIWLERNMVTIFFLLQKSARWKTSNWSSTNDFLSSLQTSFRGSPLESFT